MTTESIRGHTPQPARTTINGLTYNNLCDTVSQPHAKNCVSKARSKGYLARFIRVRPGRYRVVVQKVSTGA